MIDTREPKNGDFIAYLDQLQRESAVRLLGSDHHLITQLDKKSGSNANKDGSHFFAGRKAADMRSAAELQAALPQLVDRTAIGRLFGSLALLATGALLLMYWLIASASFLPLIVSFVLFYWGALRFQRAARRLSPRTDKQAQALVTKVFSTPLAKAK